MRFPECLRGCWTQTATTCHISWRCMETQPAGRPPVIQKTVTFFPCRTASMRVLGHCVMPRHPICDALGEITRPCPSPSRLSKISRAQAAAAPFLTGFTTVNYQHNTPSPGMNIRCSTQLLCAHVGASRTAAAVERAPGPAQFFPPPCSSPSCEAPARPRQPRLLQPPTCVGRCLTHPSLRKAVLLGLLAKLLSLAPQLSTCIRAKQISRQHGATIWAPRQLMP